MALVNQFQWLPAAELLEEAIREDPQFALAHIYAAHCYSNVQQNDRAAPHYRAAYELASGVTDRERLFIHGSYYSRFMHDDHHAEAAYKALLQRYPDDYWSVNNLRGIYNRRGMWISTETMELRERSLAIRPNDVQRLPELTEVWWYYKRTKPDETKSRKYRNHLIRWRESGLLDKHPQNLYVIYLELENALNWWSAGDVHATAKELDRLGSTLLPPSDEFRMRFAISNLGLGRIRAARTACEQIRSQVVLAECLLRVAYVREDAVLAKQQLMELRNSNPTAVIPAMTLAALFGEPDLARKWGKNSPFVNQRVMMELMETARGNPPAGMILQNGATGPTNWTLWQRMAFANVLEQQGKFDEALSMLNTESAPGSLNFMDTWNWPRCRFQLATLLRKLGRTDQAGKVEAEIRQFLAAGDPDHPVVARLN